MLTPTYIGIAPNVFVPQEGAGFIETEVGYDTGERIWLVHRDTPRASWPIVGSVDSQYSAMYLSSLKDSQEESTLIRLCASYRGAVRGSKPEVITPSCETQMWTLPVLDSGNPIRVTVPVPMPTCSRVFLTKTKPTQDGVGSPSVATFLPAPPTWDLTYTPDPASPPVRNFYPSQWVLSSRTWPELPIPWYEVTERYSYYYNIASA